MSQNLWVTSQSWVESAGEEGEHLRVLKDGTVLKTLATQILHVVFLGYSGFRFPIVHFLTNCVKASRAGNNYTTANGQSE